MFERLARAYYITLVIQHTTEKGVGLRGAPLRSRRGAGARGFEHHRDRAQLADCRLLRHCILAGALEGHQRFDQPHAWIFGFELDGVLATRADAATAERDRGHLAARQGAGRAEYIGLGALVPGFIGLVEAHGHLGQRIDGVIHFLAAVIDGVTSLRLLADAQHLRQPVVGQCTKIGAHAGVRRRARLFTLDSPGLQRSEHAVQGTRVFGVVRVLDAAFDVRPVGGRSLPPGRRRENSREQGPQETSCHHNSRKPDVMGSRAARMPGSMPAMKVRISP